MANEAVEPAAEKVYFGLTLAQHADRIRKLATERGLAGDVRDRVTAQAMAMIPTVQVNDAQR